MKSRKAVILPIFKAQMKNLVRILYLFVPAVILSMLLILSNVQTLFASSSKDILVQNEFIELEENLEHFAVKGDMQGPFLPNTIVEEIDDPIIKNAQLNYTPLLNNDIIAFYGHPNSPSMGIIGQHPLVDLEPLLNDFAAEYDAANGDRGVIPALYLIYGTCWPEGEIGYLNDEILKRYIEFALERGWLVFLDHQIGKYTVEYSVKRLLPYLVYPNVHLALDPEWRTTKPMKEIGSVKGEELNTAQQMIQDYLIENNLPEKRMLVFHQFKPWMVSNRGAVKSNYEKVNLIQCADGFGTPYQKISAYNANAEATNIPLKSFKVFSKPVIAGAGYDQPMMTAEQVLALEPKPCLIMMQ